MKSKKDFENDLKKLNRTIEDQTKRLIMMEGIKQYIEGEIEKLPEETGEPKEDPEDGN